MTETTTEQLAEIEGQGESTPVMEYTPPEGWRVLAVGEKLQAGDMWVWPNSDEQRPTIHVGAFVGSNQRYIRRIQPEPEPEPEPEPVQVREGRWRTRGGQEIPVTAMPTDHDDFSAAYPWWDGDVKTWANNGAFFNGRTAGEDLVKYLGPIEQPEKVITADDVAGEALAGVWDETKAEQQISKLETLVADLRVINAAQEKAVNAAGRENTDLQHRLDVVSKEWAEQAATINGLRAQLESVKAELVQISKDRHALQVELDAREQVPEAVSDRFDQGFEQGTARAVETIAEWLEPLRKLIDAADNFAETNLASNLASDTIQALPHIMRSLTGLADTED